MTNCMSVFFRPDYIVIKIKDEATRNEILSELKTICVHTFFSSYYPPCLFFVQFWLTTLAETTPLLAFYHFSTKISIIIVIFVIFLYKLHICTMYILVVFILNYPFLLIFYENSPVNLFTGEYLCYLLLIA